MVHGRCGSEGPTRTDDPTIFRDGPDVPDHSHRVSRGANTTLGRRLHHASERTDGWIPLLCVQSTALF